MTDDTTNKNIRNDEIDLLDLFNRMGKTINRWGKSLGRLLIISMVFLLRRWIPLGLSLLLGFGVAFFLKSSSHSIYTSDLVLRSNVIETSEMISYLNRLQTYDKQTLSKIFKIPQEICNNINDISAYWIIDKNKDRIPDYVDYQNTHDVYDTTNIRMRDRFDIRVTTNSPQELNIIRDGIIKFIRSDSLFQLRNRIRLSQNFELLERINLEIKNLDSLQKVKYYEETRKKNSHTGGQIVFLQEQNTQLLYNDILILYGRKQVLESEQIIFKEIVTVLNDFPLPTSRVNGLNFYIKQVLPPFFMFTLLLLIVIANRNKIKDVFSRY